MPHVDLNLPHHRYRVLIEAGLLAQLGQQVRAVAPHQRAALLVDEHILNTHGQTALQALRQAGYQVTLARVPAGEDHKNLDTVRALYEVLLQDKLERRSPIIALGGGITGDTAGFVAATYLRGVPFIQCPTTLLAMVDASVGGKVGVNVPQGKNLIGSFYQPVLVLADPLTLTTLPPRELACGLAECVKHAAIRDPQKFAWLQNHHQAIAQLDPATLTELVRWNVQIKAQVVMADEKETSQRAHLNFGHTFAHAIESTDPHGYGSPEGYQHGEAVALGMIAATQLAVNLGRCPASVLTQLRSLLELLGLPTRARRLADTATLLAAMQMDKKVADGKIRLVLLRQLGQVEIFDQAPLPAISEAWDCLR